MRVIEKFISVNGEGMRSGELSLFIRLAGCNLRCSYCDTLYSFIDPKYTIESVDDIVNYAKESNIRNITITGGEPMIHENIKELICKLAELGFNVEIETNGSISIEGYDYPNVSFTLDYKTPSSLMESKMDLNNYKYLKRNDTIKFVCGSMIDLNKTKEIIDNYNLVDKCNLIISPVWDNIELSSIVDFMKDNNMNGVRLQLQIHKIIWDKNKRGV